MENAGNEQLIELLNAPDKAERLDALKKISENRVASNKGLSINAEGLRIDAEGLRINASHSCSYENRVASNTVFVNNHIHTTYSFSPYSPTKAVYMAWDAGLATSGIMDHDTVAGAYEFIDASKIVNMLSTVGFECRCQTKGTPLHNRRTNNPDQVTNTYLAMHGIPYMHIKTAHDFLSPYRKNRDTRNKKMVEKLNAVKGLEKINLDYEKDVRPISMYSDGGTVTERHIIFALSLKLEKTYGRGKGMVDFLSMSLGIEVTGKNLSQLLDETNELYPYTILNILKSSLVSKFYIEAVDECPPIYDFLKLGEEIGGITSYPYLGDITDSVTGDKSAQTFEDSYLDELFEWLKEAGFKAISYMPTRNTIAQLRRVIGLCKQYGFFQISGEDINSPYQSFICEALLKDEFKHLISSTYALIGHEISAVENIEGGMFSDTWSRKIPDLDERINHFAQIGQSKGNGLHNTQV